MEHYCAHGVPGNPPIAKGEGYSTIAWIPEAQGSWALPLRHERITSWESPIDKAVWQLNQVCQYLPVRPISLWDSEYGCAPFVIKTADIAVDKLMRLRSNLCLWRVAPAYSGRGRPRIHGDKFKLNDTQTWGDPVATLEVALAKIHAPIDAGTGRSSYGRSFSADWHACPTPQTSWKISRLADWRTSST
jgi:hypothetical protein